MTELKGKRNGICNVGACNNSHAIHYNHVTEAYYCTPHARKINYGCEEGKELCSWPTADELDDEGLLKDVTEAQVKPVNTMTDKELSQAVYSARYILEDLNDKGWEQMAEITQLPLGTLVAARANIFKVG